MPREDRAMPIQRRETVDGPLVWVLGCDQRDDGGPIEWWGRSRMPKLKEDAQAVENPEGTSSAKTNRPTGCPSGNLN